VNVLLLTDSQAFAGTEKHMLDLASGLIDLKVQVWMLSGSDTIGS